MVEAASHWPLTIWPEALRSVAASLRKRAGSGLMRFQTCLEVHLELPASSRLAFPAPLLPPRFPGELFQQVQRKFRRKVPLNSSKREQNVSMIWLPIHLSGGRWEGSWGFYACQRYYLKAQKLKSNWARSSRLFVIYCGIARWKSGASALSLSHLTESASIITQ